MIQRRNELGIDWSADEIRAQLDDLGAFRRDTESERDQAEAELEEAKAVVRDALERSHVLSDRFAAKERELDERLSGIYKSTALWAHRAAQAGISEEEVVERLELGKGPGAAPEDWEYET